MKIYQVLDALDFGDGVSNDVINKYELLTEMGYKTDIYSKWCHDKVKNYRKDIQELKVEPDDIILHHISGQTFIHEELKKLQCTKVLVYHNMTPPEFLDNKDAENIKNGMKQICSVASEYQYFLGVSDFNGQNLVEMGVTDQYEVLPILIPFENMESYKTKKRKRKEKIFLFVGRVARNKKQEDIIDIFNEYFSKINYNSRLIFVGNCEYSPEYYQCLQDKIRHLPCRENIEFKGKVSDDEVYAAYNDADVFICMSEHEGFCIPLLESMYFDVLTIGFDAGAVKSTMGEAGVLVQYKDPKCIAQLIHTIFQSKNIYKELIEKQRENVLLYSREQIKKKLQELISSWTGGKQ